MSNKSTHYFRPYAKAMLERSSPDMAKDKADEAKQRQDDARFVRRLAEAIWAGDHLPEGVKRPLRLRA